MLHRLEGPDRPPELLPLPHIGDGPLQRPDGGADGFDGEHGGGAVPDGGERAEHVAVLLAQQLGPHLTQLHPSLRPCLIQRRLPHPYEPAGVPRHEEDPRPGPGEPSGVRGDQQELRAVPVEDLFHLPVEAPAAFPAPPGLYAPGPAAARPVPAVVADQTERGGQPGARHREGGGQLARRDSGQQLRALGVGAEGEDQRGREGGRGEQRRGREGPPRLLAGEGEVGERTADPAVRRGEGEPRQPELLRERLPEPGVVSGPGAHGRAHLLRAAALEQEFPQGAADLVLFGGETGVHGQAPSPDLTVRHISAGECGCPEPRRPPARRRI